ncbi:putative type 1 membrane protein [Actinidia rufa]|uniref:Putative type 1 membrane protein n=1 Tax=Actinidia rufa TaxID=165716 RepID=A0A7J0E5Q2_9ERIC|nr:putative type 1 membrane protein [Actinidia rufa]
MLLSEVGAAVSVLLGFAPPATLSAASSSKLNEVLMPNPFDKPRAVFMLDVRGAEVHADSQVMEQSVYAEFGGALSSRVIEGSTKADIQLPDEGEVSVVSLNEPLSFDSDVELTDKELSDFASFLGGTYVADALERMNGEFTIPLASGAHLSLHMSKKADREFIESLLSLVHNTRKAMDVHEDLSGSMRNPAELITGSFDGIKWEDSGGRDHLGSWDVVSFPKRKGGLGLGKSLLAWLLVGILVRGLGDLPLYGNNLTRPFEFHSVYLSHCSCLELTMFLLLPWSSVSPPIP